MANGLFIALGLVTLGILLVWWFSYGVQESNGTDKSGDVRNGGGDTPNV